MVMAKNIEKAEAILLRKAGNSLGEIANLLNVAKSSVSVWVKDVVVEKQFLIKIDQKRKDGRIKASVSLAKNNKIKREKYRQLGREYATKNNALHLKGCMLYWGEGGKETSSIRFCNSDKQMIKLFIQFLTETLCVAPSKIAVKVFCYDDVFDVLSIERYWLDTINLDGVKLLSSVVNPYPHISKGKRVGKLPFGTCHLRVNDYKLIQHIYGALEVYGGVVYHPNV